MLPQTAVRGFVTFQVARLRESLAAQFARERFHFRVNSQMFNQITLLHETLITVLAFVHSRRLVRLQMHLQIVIMAKLFVTNLALHHALPGVKSLVSLQVFQKTKTFAASAAFEILALRRTVGLVVHLHMFVQVRRVREYFIANLTLMHIGFGVQSHMRVEFALRGVTLAAAQTFERLLARVGQLMSVQLGFL